MFGLFFAPRRPSGGRTSPHAPPCSPQVSFGTIATPTPEQTTNLLNAAKSLGIPLIWKSNGKQHFESDKTVLVRKWIPQNDLLGHPKCRAFVTHGGINGVLEAAYHGVPLVGYPMFADQFTNVAMAEWRGMGLSIDKDTGTQESFEVVLKRVFQEPRCVALRAAAGHWRLACLFFRPQPSSSSHVHPPHPPHPSFREAAKAISRRVKDVPKPPAAQVRPTDRPLRFAKAAGHASFLVPLNPFPLHAACFRRRTGSSTSFATTVLATSASPRWTTLSLRRLALT